jgi:hypothetical protein
MALSVVAQARGLTREQRNAFVAAFLGWTEPRAGRRPSVGAGLPGRRPATSEQCT